MSIGFIILRHINSEKTNLYWQECYTLIRKNYPENKIVIIDDNSDYKYVSSIETHNTEFIHSEFKGRGEILPYYYYSKNKWFDTAVIIHDSVFIQEYIDFSTETYKMLWCFIEHKWDNPEEELRIIQHLTNNQSIIELHKTTQLWDGCFGCMSAIKYDFLQYLENKYTISNLVEHIKNRDDRKCFERVIACIFQTEINYYNKSLFEDIHAYTGDYTWYRYDSYVNDKPNNRFYWNKKVPVVKVFSDR